MTWTAGAQCPNATYQFRMQPPRSFTWRTVRAYGAGSTYDWNTAGLATGTYRFQVQVRRAGIDEGVRDHGPVHVHAGALTTNAPRHDRARRTLTSRPEIRLTLLGITDGHDCGSRRRLVH